MRNIIKLKIIGLFLFLYIDIGFITQFLKYDIKNKSVVIIFILLTVFLTFLMFKKKKPSQKVSINKINVELNDPLARVSAKLIIQKQKATVWMIHRAFKVSLYEAAKAIKVLIKSGIVSKTGTFRLKVNLTQKEFVNMQVQRSLFHSQHINFDNLNGHEFEVFCADLLTKNGFINVEVTRGSGDHGIDIIAEKDMISYAIQCKCYADNVGNSAVQEAHTGKSIYQKDIAVVLTNRYFTAQAKQEAKILGVKLWDRNFLNGLINTKENNHGKG